MLFQYQEHSKLQALSPCPPSQALHPFKRSSLTGRYIPRTLWEVETAFLSPGWQQMISGHSASPTHPGASSTCPGAIVGDECSHVHNPAVDGQVPHASHELPAMHREVFWQVGDTTQEQRASQIQ